jgi:hypothetical protein
MVIDDNRDGPSEGNLNSVSALTTDRFACLCYQREIVFDRSLPCGNAQTSVTDNIVHNFMMYHLRERGESPGSIHCVRRT